MSPGIDEHDVTVLLGDVREQLATLPDGSVNCVVTSPPYFGLRDYGNEQQDWPEVEFVPMVGLPAMTVPAMRCSLGLEASPWAFIAHIVLIFRDVQRALADDGVLWLNLGDSYSTRVAARPSSHQDGLNGDDYGKDWKRDKAQGLTRMPTFLPEKNMFGIPWRAAFALQADGWILRNDGIWSKPNGMPDSVQDRLSNKHEYLFLFSKSRRYLFDLDPIREPVVSTRPAALTWDRAEQGVPGQRPQHRPGRTWDERKAEGAPPHRGTDPIGSVGDSDFAADVRGKNPGDVWTVATQPFPGAHFATMPPELARRCILAGCPSDGTVLDPFAGSGTTLKVARSLGRKSIGIELNPDYIDIIRDRIGDTPFEFGSAS